MPNSARALGHQAFEILVSLEDEAQHACAVILDIQKRTHGETRITANTLYAAVNRLLEATGDGGCG